MEQQSSDYIYKNICSYIESQANGRQYHCSFPVIARRNDYLTLASFVYYFTKEDIQNGFVTRPSDWISYSITDGSILGHFNKPDGDDFTNINSRTKISLRVENANKARTNHYEICCKTLDKIRAKIINNNVINLHEYFEYITLLYEGMSRDMRQFYNDLSIEIPKENNIDLLAQEFIPYFNYSEPLTQEMAIEIIKFYASLARTFIVLDRNSINFTDNTGLPYIANIQGKTRLFVSNTLDSASNLAKYIGQVLKPNMPLVGALENLARQNDLSQILRAASGNKIDSISFGFHNINGKYQTLLTCSPLWALQALGFKQNEQYVKTLSNDAKVQQLPILNILSEQYEVVDRNFVEQKHKQEIQNNVDNNRISLNELLYLNEVKNNNIPIQQITNNSKIVQLMPKMNNANLLSLLKKYEIVYLLYNVSTDYPLLSKDNKIYIYTNIELAHASQRYFNDDEYRSVAIVRLIGANIENLLSELFFIDGVNGVIVNESVYELSTNSENLYNKEKFILKYQKENTLNGECIIVPQAKIEISKYSQILTWDVNYTTKNDDLDESFVKFLLNMFNNKFYVPSMMVRSKELLVDVKSGQIPAYVLRDNTNTTLKYIPCFTDINEFNKHYSTKEYYPNLISGGELYSSRYDGIIFNPSEFRFIELSMESYKKIKTYMDLIVNTPLNIKVTLAYKLLLYPQIGEEFEKTMRAKSFVKNPISIRNFTVKTLTENYKVSVVAAYYYLILINEKPEETLKQLEQLRK